MLVALSVHVDVHVCVVCVQLIVAPSECTEKSRRECRMGGGSGWGAYLHEPPLERASDPLVIECKGCALLLAGERMVTDMIN